MEAFAIYGPPGTGKSTEVIKRYRQLLDDGVPENRIGLVSFTKAAAKELGDRIGTNSRNIATIHSYCYRICGATRNQVIGWSHLKEFEKVVNIDISGANPDDSEELSEGDYYLSLQGLAAARMESYEETYDNSDQPGERNRFIYFAQTYDSWKKAYGYLDFADMLRLSLNCVPPPLDFLFVDEAQDLSPLQWEVIRHWAGAIGQITIAGDDDQAIYVWGGADPQGMLLFEQEHNANRLVLGQSYRIPAAVHELAQSIISRVQSRVEKVYKPRDEKGTIIRFSSEDRVKFEHGENTLVLYRNHMFRGMLEDVLLKHAVPYICDSGKPGVLQGPVMQAIKLFKKARDNIENIGLVALNDKEMRILRRWMQPTSLARMERGDYDHTLARSWQEHLRVGGDWQRYLVRIEKRYGLDVVPTIHLSTIHGSKGREADRVVLINGVTERIAENYSTDLDLRDAELRTFYVAVTRARHTLEIVDGDNALSVLYAMTKQGAAADSIHNGTVGSDVDTFDELERMRGEMGEWWDPDNECWMPSGRTNK